MKNIGKVIGALREKKGISMQELARGIASIAEISRIESGQQEPDGFLAEALFQRMGKSVDKLELMVAPEEYEMVLTRSLIIANMNSGDYELADILVEDYRDCSMSQKPLQRQYLLMIRALIHYLVETDEKECITRLEQAIEVTLPGWRQVDRKEIYLCSQEVRLLMFLGYFFMLAGDQRGTRLLVQTWRYLQKNVTDGEERVKVLPQCAWMLATCYLKCGDVQSAERYCNDGIACLCENGAVAMLMQLLQLREECYNKLGWARQAEENQIQKTALRTLYEIARYEESENIICLFLQGSEQKEYMASNECLRQLRKSQDMSQERLSEGICTWETLSRIENGVRKPNRNKLHMLLEKLGSDRRTYYGYVDSQDFSVYEMVRKSRNDWARGAYEDSIALLRQIETCIDMNIPQNKQYIGSMLLLKEFRFRQISDEEMVAEFERLLRYTMKNYCGTVYRTPFRGEADIINIIALCKRRMGRYEEAAALYEQVFQWYRSGLVQERHHLIPLMSLYTNYVALLSKLERNETASEVALRGMKLILNCKRIDGAAELLANYAGILLFNKSEETTTLCKKYLHSSCVLLEMFGFREGSKAVKRYYENNFDEKLFMDSFFTNG